MTKNIRIFSKRYDLLETKDDIQKLTSILERENIVYELNKIGEYVEPISSIEFEKDRILKENELVENIVEYSEIFINVDDIERVMSIVPEELLNIDEIEIPYKMRIENWDELNEKFSSEIIKIRKYIKRTESSIFLLKVNKLILILLVLYAVCNFEDFGIIAVLFAILSGVPHVMIEELSIKKKLRVEDFYNICFKEFMKIKFDLYNVEDDSYNKNDIENKCIFEIFKFDNVFSKNKVVSNNSEVIFTDLKLTQIETDISGTHVHTDSTVIFDGVILEFDKRFQIDTPIYISNCYHEKFNDFEILYIKDDDERENDIAVYGEINRSFDNQYFLASHEKYGIPKDIYWCAKSCLDKFYDKYHFEILICIESYKVSVLFNNFKLFEDVDFNSKLSDVEILENQIKSFEDKIEVIEKVIKVLENLEID